MHGHQLHGVVRRLRVHKNIAARFVKISQVLYEIMQRPSVAFLLPFLHKCLEAIEIVRIALGGQRRNADRRGQFGKHFLRVRFFRSCAHRKDELDQFAFAGILRRRARQSFFLACPRFKLFPQRFPSALLGALGHADKIPGLDSPVGNRENARARHIIRRDGNQSHVCKQVANERARKNRKPPNHKGNLPPRERFHQARPMRVLAVERREVAPGHAGRVEFLDLVRNPFSLFFGPAELDDPNFLSLGIFRVERREWHVTRIVALCRYHPRHSQDSLRRAVILRQMDARPFLFRHFTRHAAKILEKGLQAAK